jgi:hypothetical protein
MRHLLHFSYTSSVSILIMSTNTACRFPLGLREKKQASHKVLIGLIALIFLAQTIHNACDWYITWIHFIYHGNTPTVEALEGDTETSPSVYIVQSMLELLTTLRLAIADSIMVSTRLVLLLTPLIAFDLKVWRSWIICNRSWQAVIVPLVFNLGSIGTRWLVGIHELISTCSFGDNRI